MKSIEEYQGLIHQIARQIWEFIGHAVPYEDLVGYGQVGLMEARKRFDPGRGLQFSTFAYYRIRGAILDGIRSMSGLPVGIVRKIRIQKALMNQVEDRFSGPMDRGDPASLWNGMTQMLHDLEGVYLITLAFDVEDETLRDNEDRIGRQQLITLVRGLLTQLPEKESLLIRKIYYEDKSAAEAAKELGMSRSWASRKHREILQWIAEKLNYPQPLQEPQPRGMELR